MSAKPRAMLVEPPPPLLLRERTRISYSSSSLINFKLARHSIVSLMAKTNKNNNATTVVADRLNNKTTPWLMLPPQVDQNTGETLDCFYSLADSKTVKLNRNKSLKVPDTAKCISSTVGSWLAFADHKDASLYLSNPFLNDVVELPSLATLPEVLGVEKDPDGTLYFKVPSGESYYRWGGGDIDPTMKYNPDSMVRSMILSIALSYKDPRDYLCDAMAVQGTWRHLAYCHIGRKYYDPNNYATDVRMWTGLQEDSYEYGSSNQVVYSDQSKLWYSINKEGILAYDVQRDRGRRSKKVSLFRMEKLEEQSGEGVPRWLKELKSTTTNICLVYYYLVTLDNGDLWLIVRHVLEGPKGSPIYIYKTLHFDVFRVAYPGRLERVTSLKDRAIFIGSNQSFCIKARGRIRPNSIYFTDDLSSKCWTIWGSGDMGIFNMKNGKITQFYTYQDEHEEKKVAMPLFWIAPLTIDTTC